MCERIAANVERCAKTLQGTAKDYKNTAFLKSLKMP